MSIKGQIIRGGEICWLHFKLDTPNPQSGDYAYQKAYAPNRSEKIEDGETYVKVKIKTVWWKYDKICFNIITVNRDKSESYDTQVYNAERLTLS
jgi:hypothetical protein